MYGEGLHGIIHSGMPIGMQLAWCVDLTVHRNGRRAITVRSSKLFTGGWTA